MTRQIRLYQLVFKKTQLAELNLLCLCSKVFYFYKIISESVKLSYCKMLENRMKSSLSGGLTFLFFLHPFGANSDTEFLLKKQCLSVFQRSFTI